LWEEDFQQQVQSYLLQSANEANQNRSVTYYIPVVIHLLYRSSTEGSIGTKANLHPNQIKAQMVALNEVFAGNAPGNSALPAVFSNVDANDVGITFCLAAIDKNGSSMTEPGVDRIDWEKKGWTNPGSFNDYSSLVNYFDNTIKPATIWDPVKYLNIWLGDFNSGTGYATFPASSNLSGITSSMGTKTTDGIFVSTKIFGCKTTYPNGYYFTSGFGTDYVEGDITAHEIGHWLGLLHIWADATCGNDYCADTPPQENSNQVKCPQHPYKKGYCSGNTTGEMFQNYMGYTQDACMCLFTADQKTRMLTAMTYSPYRKLLGTHGLCNSPTSVSNYSDKENLSFDVLFDNAAGVITASFHSLEQRNYMLEVRNVLGQIVYSEQINNFSGSYSKQVQLSHFKNGLYLISLSNAYTQSVKKVVLNK
jgi:zinc-dependent metalloproteinase lipoprotein